MDLACPPLHLNLCFLHCLYSRNSWITQNMHRWLIIQLYCKLYCASCQENTEPISLNLSLGPDLLVITYMKIELGSPMNWISLSIFNCTNRLQTHPSAIFKISFKHFLCCWPWPSLRFWCEGNMFLIPDFIIWTSIFKLLYFFLTMRFKQSNICLQKHTEHIIAIMFKN